MRLTPFVRDNLSPTLQGKKILLGISGSIAAFKACDIVRYLKDCGAEVRVVLTESAQKFVTTTTLETLSGQPVCTDMWHNGDAVQSAHGTHHIDASRWADLILVAPASANTIARLANGLADDLLSTEILAATCPVLIAPAMNPAMWNHPATQENIARVSRYGYTNLSPADGKTACGEEGTGRMLEPEIIVEKIAQTFYQKNNGKHALVTLGPTRSPVDPVRYFTNKSSGLMGAALCWALVARGYKVSAVCGPTDAPLPSGIDTYSVTTAQEMLKQSQNIFLKTDLLIAAAAVLDWDVSNPSSEKMKKDGKPFQIDFAANPDILATLARQKTKNQFILGFAAETQNITENALSKLKQKNCDAIFANDVSRSDQGFESTNNAGWWITPGKPPQSIPLTSKSALARKLVDLIEGAAHV